MAFAAIFFLFGSGSTRPTQHELLARFNEGRISFERLRFIFVEDGLATVGEYGRMFAWKPYEWFPADKAGITESRGREYKKLMEATKVKRIDRREDGAVSIMMDGWGMANRGWRLMLVSQTNTPPDLLDSLDNFKKSQREWEDAYSHLTNDWYLYILW